MSIQSQQIISILQYFKADLQKLYGKQMVGLILYGSYARGDIHEFSDIDVLVLLNQMQSPYVEIRRMSDISYDYMERYEMIISTIPTTTDRYKNLNTPLYRNIKKEGIKI